MTTTRFDPQGPPTYEFHTIIRYQPAEAKPKWLAANEVAQSLVTSADLRGAAIDIEYLPASAEAGTRRRPDPIVMTDTDLLNDLRRLICERVGTGAATVPAAMRALKRIGANP